MNPLIYSAILFLMTGACGKAQVINPTIITPHLNVTVGETENIIYTSTFALAWKMLEDDILRSTVIVKENIPLVGYLNNSEPAAINEQHSVNLAGFVKDGIDRKIAGELEHKFKKAIDLSMYAEDPSNIICYSFFKKEVRFKTSFEVFDQLFPFYSGGKQYDVACFGIWTAGSSDWHQGIRELVTVIDFKNMTEFIISISNPGEEDEVIIAVCRPGETFRETIDALVRRMKNARPTSLEDNDRLIVPKVVIDAHKKYEELYGVHLANRNFEKYFFAVAEQNICFELNEGGAFADSEAKVVLKKGPGPRTMIINRPFLIMMKEKKSDNPYFAAWIANPELLVQGN